MATRDGELPTIRTLQRRLQQTGVCTDCGQEIVEQHYVQRFNKDTTVCTDCCDCHSTGGDA